MNDYERRNARALASCQRAWENPPDDWSWYQDEEPEECEDDYDYCPHCKTVNGCSCDEQYEAWKDHKRGL